MKIPRSELLTALPHLILCALLVLFGGQRGDTFMIVPLLPFLLIGLPWSAYIIWRKPGKRRRQLALLALWLVTAGIVLGLAQWRAPRIRNEAERVVAELDTYHRLHGRYPAKLEDIGRNSQKLRADWGILYHLPENGNSIPLLYYQSASNRFDTYVWDAAARSWEFHPD